MVEEIGNKILVFFGKVRVFVFVGKKSVSMDYSGL